MRVNARSRRRASSRTRRSSRRVRAGAGARRGRPPARARLARRRPLAPRPPARPARARAAPGDGGADVDPRVHGRPRRLADVGGRRPRRAAGRADRHGRRPLLRDGPRQALGADGDARSPRSARRRGPRRTATLVAEVQRSYDAGVTDEFIEPVVLDGAPRLGRDDAAIFFNFRPDRARQLAHELLEAGFDLTTMTRYRTTSTCRSRSPSRWSRDARGGARRARARGSSTSPRRRSTRTSPTSSTAARGRSGRGRRGSSSLPRATSRATTRSPRCPRARWRRASPPRSAAATASPSSTSPTRTWSGTRARSRP